MKRFRITWVGCEKCGGVQDPDRWVGECGDCGCVRFRVEIERSAWGLESFELEDFIPKPGLAALLDDGPGEPFWRTQSFLTCAGISGAEIAAFCSASLEVRRRHYVRWKRRELEAALTKRRRICGRCRIIYRIYKNVWNPAGFCSRTCWSAAAKRNKRTK